MNRKQMLVDILNAGVALRDDMRLRGYPGCALRIADRHKIGPVSFRRMYDGLIEFQEFDEQGAPLFGYWRYKLGLRSYELTLVWRRNAAHDKQWDLACRLNWKYTDFVPVYFAAFVMDASLAILTWHEKHSNNQK